MFIGLQEIVGFVFPFFIRFVNFKYWIFLLCWVSFKFDLNCRPHNAMIWINWCFWYTVNVLDCVCPSLFYKTVQNVPVSMVLSTLRFSFPLVYNRIGGFGEVCIHYIETIGFTIVCKSEYIINRIHFGLSFQEVCLYSKHMCSRYVFFIFKSDV